MEPRIGHTEQNKYWGHALQGRVLEMVMWVHKIQIIPTFLLIPAQETLAIIKMDISIFSLHKKDQRYPGIDNTAILHWRHHLENSCRGDWATESISA